MTSGHSPKTKLAAWRARRRLTQIEMIEATGIAPATYRRLERGEHRNPQLRWLANCALVLGVTVEDLIEDEWREWSQIGDGPVDAPPQGGIRQQIDPKLIDTLERFAEKKQRDGRWK